MGKSVPPYRRKILIGWTLWCQENCLERSDIPRWNFVYKSRTQGAGKWFNGMKNPSVVCEVRLLKLVKLTWGKNWKIIIYMHRIHRKWSRNFLRTYPPNKSHRDMPSFFTINRNFYSGKYSIIVLEQNAAPSCLRLSYECCNTLVWSRFDHVLRKDSVCAKFQVLNKCKSTFSKNTKFKSGYFRSTITGNSNC